MQILNFGLVQILTWLLVFARSAGIFTTAPIFGNAHVSMFTRVGMAACLAFIFAPMVAAANMPVPSDTLSLAAAVVKEAVVGLMIGFVGMLLFMVVQAAAEMIDMQIGFGFANIVDPMMNQHTSVIGQFQYMAATLIFLGMNGHHLLLQGLADSFSVLPLGHVSLSAAATHSMLNTFARLFLAAMKIGGPVVGVILLTDVALGILARTVPQLNVLVVGFPAKIIVGLLTVIVAMPAAFIVVQDLFAGLGTDINLLVRTLAH
jgi:flagellar biosynthesis protein FliR